MIITPTTDSKLKIKYFLHLTSCISSHVIFVGHSEIKKDLAERSHEGSSFRVLAYKTFGADPNHQSLVCLIGVNLLTKT